MAKSYLPDSPTEFTQKKSRYKKNQRSEEESNDDKKYLNIWDVNPTFKDINIYYSIAKTIILLVISVLFIISLYLLTRDLAISLAAGIGFALVFLLVFHNEIFMLKKVFSFSFHKRTSFNPFGELVFWYDTNDPFTICISNKNDLTHSVIRIFKVDVIPENVHSSIRQFVKALSSKNIKLSYSYQIVQKPLIKSFQRDTSSNAKLNYTEPVFSTIYFSVYYNTKGVLTEYKINKLNYYIKKLSNDFKSNLIANFHHFRITLLSDNNLFNAIRTFFTRETTSEIKTKKDKRNVLKDNNFNALAKFSLLAAILAYIDYIFLKFHLSIFYIALISFMFFVIFTLIWWRSIFFQISKSKLVKKETLSIVNLFDHIKFYKVRKHPYSLYIHIDNQLLIGLKMVNLKYIYRSPFCLFGKFLESLNNHKISYSYTLKNQPINYHEFYKFGLKHIHEKLKDFILFSSEYGIKSEAEAEQWLGYRSGMWYSTLTLTVNSYTFKKSINDCNFDQLEDDLSSKIDILRGAFNLNFQNYEIEDLNSQVLISGYLFTALKNNYFRLNGSHLNYLMVQGANLSPLTTIADILRKGIDTMIAAEFNTPLYLENFITIGHTRNTEVLENEVSFGFTREQTKNLLIVNGTTISRDYAAMKIVSELIKAQIPSLVFDFNGTWSTLINYFKNSDFQKEILHFKLGSAFTIDPLVSDIAYDTDNTGFLEYMLDAYGIAFKKDQRIIEMFRNTIKKNPGMDLPSMNLDLQTQKDWEKSPINDSLLNLFSDFTQQDLTFFQGFQGDIKNKITCHDFVTNNKTVIIDLSIIRDLDKKLFFVFLILSKIIHYIKNDEQFIKKTIIIPNIDIYFDSRYLDLKMNYGKINSFLDPLIEREFGFIFLANQIRYLHPNLFNYFANIMTFRATDHRDVTTLGSLLNLQELEGIGYYSLTRNQTYQLKYLKSLKNNGVIVRRDDIYQPFPAIIDWEDIKKVKKLTYEEIVQFMQQQGYNLKYTERKILEQAKKTLFDIDLGHYILYLEEVIKFLDEVQNFDQVGNLYASKLKKQLKEIIYPKISQKTQNKERIKNIRDGLFEILKKHGYLVENHPRRASGSEALRTSYSVGPRYQEALKDYYKIKGKASANINVEILEKGIGEQEDLTHLFQEQPSRKYIIQKENLKQALAREFSDLNYDIFNIYLFIKKNDYQNALKIEHGLINKFLMNVYKHFYNVDISPEPDKLTTFLTHLTNIEGFPFTDQELMEYVEKYQVIEIESESIEARVEQVYHQIYNFFIKIQNYLYENDEKNGRF